MCLVADTLCIRVRFCRSRIRSRVDSSLQIDQGDQMKRNTLFASLGLVLLFGSVFSLGAQVKQVQMHIDGYLCGN